MSDMHHIVTGEAGQPPLVDPQDHSRRSVLKGLIMAEGGALALGQARPAAARDHGSVSWRPIVPGTSITRFAFRIRTGDDDLGGPSDVLDVSAITHLSSSVTGSAIRRSPRISTAAMDDPITPSGISGFPSPVPA